MAIRAGLSDKMLSYNTVKNNTKIVFSYGRNGTDPGFGLALVKMFKAAQVTLLISSSQTLMRSVLVSVVLQIYLHLGSCMDKLPHRVLVK